MCWPRPDGPFLCGFPRRTMTDSNRRRRLDTSFSDEHEAFREQARAFLDANLPEDLKRAQRLCPGIFLDYEHNIRWHRILHRQGWVAPAWPKEHGGPGWGPDPPLPLVHRGHPGGGAEPGADGPRHVRPHADWLRHRSAEGRVAAPHSVWGGLLVPRLFGARVGVPTWPP